MAKDAETKRIEAMYGPFAGGMIDVPADIADKGIADGWARDPFATPDPNAEQPAWNPEAHDKMMAAADAAARKIRGEETEDEVKAAKRGAAAPKQPDADDNSGGGNDANEDTQAAVAKARTTQVEAARDPAKGYQTRTTRKRD